MAQNRFTNPVDGTFYDWHKNHDWDGEDDYGKSLTITRVPNTAGGVAAFQQGDDGSLVLKLKGSIVVREQWRQFWHWFAISKQHTIYFTDFDGQEFEGIISSLLGHRVGHLRSGAKDPGMATHKFVYQMEFTVLGFLSGDLHDMGVLP